jgi:hypothetical protein
VIEAALLTGSVTAPGIFGQVHRVVTCTGCRSAGRFGGGCAAVACFDAADSQASRCLLGACGPSFGFIGTGQLAVKRFTCIYLTKEPMARPWEEICTVSEVEPKQNKQNLRKIKQLLIGLGDEWMCAGLW